MTGILKHRVRDSLNWVIIGYFFTHLFRLGGNLVLTRLLVPEMFGVMAIVGVIIIGLAMFSDVGLLQNIIHSKRGGDRDYLNTAWSIQVIRGFVLFFITLIISGCLYQFGQAGYISPEVAYGDKQLPLILAIVSITLVISGFNSIHLLVLNRKLMVKRLVAIELFSQVSGLLFIIIWAYYFHDIWALVYGRIITATLSMVASHAIKVGGRCEFYWENGAAKEILHFGKWIFVTSFLGFLLNQGDRLILGALIPPEVLGVYSVAFVLASAVLALMQKLIGSIFLPALGYVARDTPERLEEIYYKLRSRIDAISMFSAGFIFSTARSIVDILYDARYIDAAWMLQILSISVICTGWLLANECFVVTGKPKIVAYNSFFQVIFMYVAMPSVFYFSGLKGAIYIIALSPAFRALISMILMKRNLFLDLRKEFVMLPMLVVGLLIGEVVDGVMVGLIK